MRFPRYRLRTLIAGVTLIGLLLGCVFSGWAEPLLIGLSLKPGETQVYETTIEVAPDRWERLVRCYTIDPAQFVLEIVEQDGKRREVVVGGHGTRLVGLRWLQMQIAVRDGELRIRDATSGEEIIGNASAGNENWPTSHEGDGQTSGGRGSGFNVGPGVWLFTQNSRRQ